MFLYQARISVIPTSVAVFLAATSVIAQQQPKNSDPISGEKLYSQNCASCHGEDLEGQKDWRSPDENGVLPAPPHDRTGHTWHHGDALLFTYTKLGGQAALEQMGVTGVQSGMPAFEDSLSDQDIWDILAFIKSSWPNREQEVQQQRTDSEQ